MLQNEFENIGYNELMKQWKNKKLLDELKEVKTLKRSRLKHLMYTRNLKNLYLKKKALKESEKKLIHN